ncbi:diguanylate cyclase domain-containing protein [Comamonas nitrativorans]|uniref:diguanylate cyclase n=1 Tax=Comamonas nitrativorans TaxID=108437 RepID=A0ABV9GU87_9BURK
MEALTREKNAAYKKQKRGYWLLVLGVVLLALSSVVWVYERRSDEYSLQVQERLRLVGEVQSKSVADWRRARMADAGALSQDPLFSKALAEWLHSQQRDHRQEALLRQRLRVLVEYDQYALVYLLDTRGQLLMSTDSAALPRPLPAQERQALQQALDRAEPVAVEPQAPGYFAFPFFGVMTPLYDGFEPVGVAWLVMDLRGTLFPLVQAWQVQSQSAEAVLTQLEGEDSVININPLPKSGVAALSKPLPLTRSGPAMQAVRGGRGIVRGVNHMDQPVISMVSAIDGAPWWLIVQIDEAEILNDARRREGLAFGLLIGALLLLLALLGGIWQWSAWRAERTLKRELQLHIRWLDSAQQAAALGYFVYDLGKKEFYISEITARIFGVAAGGWLPLHRWAALVEKEDRKAVFAAHEQTIAQRQHLHVQYRIRRADNGVQRWIQVWAELDGREGERPSCMIGIVQDITERKQVDEQLEEYRRQLENQVRLDPLTGIANRLALQEALHKEWRRAARHGQSVALLMLDLDYFKAYNDTYGHVQGDVCLCEVARVLAASVGREGELVARYGGEEFMVLLPGSTLAQAQAFGQQLVLAVQRLDLPHAGSSVPGQRVTISVGVACARPGGLQEPEQTDGFTALIERADGALYAAKQAGRDRCCAVPGP